MTVGLLKVHLSEQNYFAYIPRGIICRVSINLIKYCNCIYIYDFDSFIRQPLHTSCLFTFSENKPTNTIVYVYILQSFTI